jgi:hypothetical protein
MENRNGYYGSREHIEDDFIEAGYRDLDGVFKTFGLYAYLKHLLWSRLRRFTLILKRRVKGSAYINFK